MTMTQGVLSCGMLVGVITAAALTGCAPRQSRLYEIDTQAEPVFRQMCVTLDSAKAFRVRVRAVTDRPVGTGQLAQFHRTSEVTVVRPDRLRAETNSDDGNWSVWYRAGSLTLLDREANIYATQSVPGRIDQMLDYMVDHYDIIMPMADLVAGKTYDSLLANVEEGTYVGLHLVGEAECHHLLYRQESIDWQIWIDAHSNLPLPRKLVITYTQEPGHPQYLATMDNWDLAPALSDETFTFVAPAGATEAPMSELVAGE